MNMPQNILYTPDCNIKCLIRNGSGEGELWVASGVEVWRATLAQYSTLILPTCYRTFLEIEHPFLENFFIIVYFLFPATSAKKCFFQSTSTQSSLGDKNERATKRKIAQVSIKWQTL